MLRTAAALHRIHIRNNSPFTHPTRQMKSKPIEFSIQFRNAELHFTQTAGRRRPDANWLDCRAPAIIIEQRATSLTIISALVAETARLRSMISNSITSDPNSQMYQTTLMGRAAVLLVILSNRTTSHHIAPKMLVSRRHSNIIGSMVAADCTIFACVENTNRIYSSRLYCQDSAQVHNTNTSLASTIWSPASLLIEGVDVP